MANPEWDNYDHHCTICNEPIGSGVFVGDGDGTGQRFAHKTCFDLREVKKAATDLINKLDEIHFNPSYKSVWTIAHLHNVSYTGPSYDDELKKLRKLVK